MKLTVVYSNIFLNQTTTWNLLSGNGCEDCRCNPIGSVNQTCDELYGTCECRPGIGGDKCDKCLPGYFGFSREGCESRSLF